MQQKLVDLPVGMMRCYDCMTWDSSASWHLIPESDVVRDPNRTRVVPRLAYRCRTCLIKNWFKIESKSADDFQTITKPFDRSIWGHDEVVQERSTDFKKQKLRILNSGYTSCMLCHSIFRNPIITKKFSKKEREEPRKCKTRKSMRNCRDRKCRTIIAKINIATLENGCDYHINSDKIRSITFVCKTCARHYSIGKMRFFFKCECNFKPKECRKRMMMPEIQVQKNYEKILKDMYGFDSSYIETEKTIIRGSSKSDRADIVIYDSR